MILWALPNYAAIVVLVTLAFVEPSMPLRVQHTVDGFWMLVALLLPISTIMAAIKAVQLSIRAVDGTQVRVWRPVLAWGVVAFALAFNVFSYIVISHTLR